LAIRRKSIGAIHILMLRSSEADESGLA
jgi:hypothetical protein